jgi:hypothetical protein
MVKYKIIKEQENLVKIRASFESHPGSLSLGRRKRIRSGSYFGNFQ